MPARGGTVRLQIPSNFELLDVIQVASDRLAVLAGLDEDADPLDRRRGARVGHQRDQARQPRGLRQARDRRVLPLARRRPRPSSSSGSSTREKGSSRRKSPIRSRRKTSSNPAAAASSSCAASWTTSCCDARPKAAWKCAWSRSSPPVPEPSIPPFSPPPIEAVIRAGDVQLSRVGAAMQIEKKGTIDLVTETDREIEREFRALIAARFPVSRGARRRVLRPADRDRVPEFCWVFDPIDGTTNFAHGLPIFCSSLALEIDGEAVVGAVYDPNRRELFTAERGRGAWLNGAPLRVSSADDADRRAALHRVSLQRAAETRRARRPLRRTFSGSRARCAGSAPRPSISATSPPAGSTASGKCTSTPGTSPPAR